MEPRQRLFPAGDPTYQVKTLGSLTDSDLHVFLHDGVLDAVLADAAAHDGKLRAGALVGGRYADGGKRFLEVEGAVVLIEDRPAAQPFALDAGHARALTAQIAKTYPGREELGLWVTHPKLGLYLSRSETAAVGGRFDLTWTVALVVDPVADKFSLFTFRKNSPVKSGFHTCTRSGVTPPPPLVIAAPVAAPAEPAEGTQLTREELFRLATEEVFKDGKVDEDENRTLQLLGGLLKLDKDTAIRIAKQARKKYRAGQIPGEGRFDPRVLYQRATELAMADGELESDEAKILAALRKVFKLEDAPARTAASSFAAAPAPRRTFADLLTAYAGIAFDRQVDALDRLGDHTFTWDLEGGRIALAGEEYAMQTLGSVSEADQTWTWAWAMTDRALPPEVLAHARRLRGIGESQGIAELTTPTLALSAVDPNELAMVASGLTDAYLYYRIPQGRDATYVLITDERFGRSTQTAAVRVPLVFPRLLDTFTLPARPALICYLRAAGLEVSEDGPRIVGRQGNEAVVATFDAAGGLIGVQSESAGSGVRRR